MFQGFGSIFLSRGCNIDEIIIMNTFEMNQNYGLSLLTRNNMDLPLFVIVPAPMVRKLIVLGLLSPKPLEADFFLEISKTSENKKRPNS